MNSFQLICLTILYQNIYFLSATDELITSVVVTSVGASAPLCGLIYPSYNIDMSKWTNGLNNLTDSGIMGDYQKGQGLRQRYNLIKSDNREIRVEFIENGDYKSSLSALATYKGFNGQEIDGHLEEIKMAAGGNLENIRVDPNLLLDSMDRCEPFIKRIAEDCLRSDSYNSYMGDRSPLMDTLKRNTGYGDNWMSLYSASISLTLAADRHQSNELPEWATPEIIEGTALAFLQATPKNCGTSMDWYKNVLGLLNNDIINKINCSCATSESDKLNIYVYTTFFYTFFFLFDQFNVSQKIIDPSSEFLMEVWSTGEAGNITKEVRMFYKNGVNGTYESLGEPQSLDTFISHLNNYKTTDVEHVMQECSVPGLSGAKVYHPQALNC